MRLISTWRVELQKPTLAEAGRPIRVQGAKHSDSDLLTSAKDWTMSETL